MVVKESTNSWKIFSDKILDKEIGKICFSKLETKYFKEKMYRELEKQGRNKKFMKPLYFKGFQIKSVKRGRRDRSISSLLLPYKTFINKGFKKVKAENLNIIILYTLFIISSFD